MKIPQLITFLKVNSAHFLLKCSVPGPQPQKKSKVSLAPATGDARTNKVWQFAQVLLIGMITAIFYHYNSGYYNNEAYPSNTFLFAPNDSGNDFINIFQPVNGLSPYQSPLFVYFPFTYLLVLPFTIFKEKNALHVFLLIFILFIIKFIYSYLDFLTAQPRKFFTIAFVFLSYPFLFCIDRANFECVLFILLACFLISFSKNKPKSSIFFLSAATAMKVYPGVFVVLLLASRRIKEALWTIALTAGLTFMGLILMPGRILENINLFLSNLERFRLNYVIGDSGIPFGSNWFSPLKIILNLALGTSVFQTPYQDTILKIYSIFCLACFAVISFFIIFRIHTLWKQVTLLTFSMILFPQVSFDYKLIHLFLPLVLFLSDPKTDRKNYRYCLLFGLLFIPKAYGKNGVWSVFLNPFLMTVMMSLIFLDYLTSQTKQTTAIL